MLIEKANELDRASKGCTPQFSAEAPIDENGNFSLEGLLGMYIVMVLRGDRMLYPQVVNSRETSTVDIDLSPPDIRR